MFMITMKIDFDSDNDYYMMMAKMMIIKNYV
jgi:hypothetical protein